MNAGRELFLYHKTEQLRSQTSSNYSLVLCALGKSSILEKMSLCGTASWTSIRVCVLQRQHCIWYVIQKLLQKVHVNYTLPHVESQAAKRYCSKHPCSHELQPLFTSIQGKKINKNDINTDLMLRFFTRGTAVYTSLPHIREKAQLTRTVEGWQQAELKTRCFKFLKPEFMQTKQIFFSASLKKKKKKQP